MRGTLLRFGSAALLAAAVCWLASSGGRFAAAQPVPSAKKADKKDEKEKDTRSRRAVASPFNFNVVRDAGPRLKAARDYLGFKEIPWNTVCPLVQNILDGPDSFYDPDEDDPRGNLANKAWGGVQHEAEQILSKFPREGLEFYQQLYGQTAAALLDESAKNGYDLEGLKAVTSRYFYTKAGAEGTVLLASVQLERGDYADAARHFARLMARPNADEYLTPRVLFRAATAFKRSPEKEHTALFADAADRLHKATARDGLAIGRKTFTADQLRAELDRPVGSVDVTAAAGQFATHRGNAQRNPVSDAGPPFLFPAFTTRMLFDGPEAQRKAKAPGDEWVDEQLQKLFARDESGRPAKAFPLPGFFPVATADLVVYRQYDGVRAVALRDHSANGALVRAGQPRWHSATPFGLAPMVAGPDTDTTDGWRSPYYDQAKDIKTTVERWWNQYRSQTAAAYLAENPLIGSLSHDGAHVYFLDDIALPPPPAVPTPTFGAPPGQAAQGVPSRLEAAISAGQLVAVDLQTGIQAWTLGRDEVMPSRDIPPAPRGLTEEDADKTTSAFLLCRNAVFLAPPLPVNGRLYVPIDQAGYVRLVCLDPTNLVQPAGWHMKVPSLVWQVKLGRAGTTLETSPARRTQGAFLAAGDGILVCPTNSGAVVGIDLMSRRILWGHVYRDTPVPLAPPPPVGPGGGRIVGGVRAQAPDPLPQERWRASAPIVVGGRVVVGGYDSESIDCLDLRTGRLVWRARRQPTDLYLGAVVNDVLMVVGKESVRGYRVGGDGDGGERAEAFPPVSLGTAVPTGHGAAGKNAYYVPVREEVKPGSDPNAALQVWAVGPDGKVVSKTRAARELSPLAAQYGIGNLLFQDGLVIAQSAAEVAVFPQREEKRAEMDRRLTANPNDPDGLLSRGDFLQDEGKLKEAVADYKAAEKNVPSDPVKAEGLRRRVREGLYRAYTELLRQNFAAAEPFLDEYAALCESYLEPTETADDEAGHQARVDDRRRLYLSLLAKGREGQGRLAEAFDHYVALARLGADQLQPDPDEPSVLRRADVAARGRVQAMIQRAGPDARKGLEGRVAREWEAVKGGTDLARLREFVASFGPYFPVGAEAELLLADRLAATGDDADARDAQLHLHHVRSTAAAPPLRARATADLAGLMVKAGLLDEAVRLYLQLGGEFKDVAVRDGKTGTDYLTDLLTDRRLLPYLEPARYPLPARVRAEDRSAGGGAQFSPQSEVVPTGELLPEFRKLRFTLDTNPGTGNGRWAVRGYDRATDAERYTLQGIQSFPSYGQGITGRAFFAGGRVLVAQVGPNLYAYDLGTKARDPAWTLSLAPDAPPNAGANVPRPGGDEIDIPLPDGTKATIRFTGVVVRAGYACVLTRDGLECFDPTDRTRKFWTRRNVPERTLVFGDDGHVVLVELGENRRPTRVRVLRASDGSPVDGAPDSAEVLRDARSYRVYGRTALLHEEADDGSQVLRLLDLGTGQDVWRRGYDDKAVAVKSHDPDVCGMVRPTGDVDVLDPHTGHPVGAFKLDADRLADHFGPCRGAQLLADADRFYLVLDRNPGGGGGRGGFTVNTPLRTTPVNGPVYCFRRATGERAWYAEHHFENQQLFLDRFADLPVLVAAQSGFRAGGGTEFRAVVVEKDRGLLRLAIAQPDPVNTTFQSLTVDPRNRTVELVRPQSNRPLRVVVMPEAQ